MVSSSQSGRGAPVLRCACTMHRGSEQFTGSMSLDEEFLFFRSVPDAPDKRPLAWELPRRVLDTVTLSEDSQWLVLQVGDVQHRFEGSGFGPLFAALQPEHSTLVTGSFEIPDFGDEPVLLEGAINLFVNNLVSARGQLTLTENELTFEPKEGLETALWKDLGTTISLADIDDVSVVGIRRQVVITAGVDRLVLGGALAPRVYGILLCLRGDTITLSPHEVLFTWTVSLYRGAVAIAGELIGSWRRLRFVPSGRIDALFGLDEEISLRMNDITRVEVRGRLERRLVISSEGDELSFDLPDPGERFEELKDFLVELDHESEPVLPEGGASERDADIDALLEDWKGRRPFLAGARLHLLGGALDLSRPNRARRGWLGLFDQRLVFLPVGRVWAETPLVVAADDISRATQGMAPPEHLYLGVGASTLRFLPRGGDKFAANFWSRWQALVEHTPTATPTAIDQTGGYGDDGEFNRRDAYRVSAPPSTQVYLESAGSKEQPSQQVLFTDLAPEGCALLIDKELSVGAVHNIQLPDWLIGQDDANKALPGLSTGSFAVPCGPVPATVVYSHKLRGQRWRHGFAFEDLDRKQDLWVRSLYMCLQRDEVRLKKDWEPGSEGASSSDATASPKGKPGDLGHPVLPSE